MKYSALKYLSVNILLNTVNTALFPNVPTSPLCLKMASC